ncbi:hypothetical protein [Streptomyces sp. NPDC058297]|uniref:hypothetical protein n=1 Tax=Streptomyces sp. NPDC058297 TaxID=3346433 RepID=UPI0036E34ABC
MTTTPRTHDHDSATEAVRVTEKRRLAPAGRALVPLLATVLVVLLAGTWLMSGALVERASRSSGAPRTPPPIRCSTG